MRLAAWTAGLLLAPTVLVLTAQPAAAAPPGNDMFANALPVALGFSQELDTREATTEPLDREREELIQCGAPAVDATVWYSFTSATEVPVVVDASQSDYSVGVLIVEGFYELGCPRAVKGFVAAAGTTYQVMAFDDQLDGTGHGGTLRISFSQGPPAPTASVTIERVGRVNTRTGNATIRGTYTCTNADWITISTSVGQDVAPGVTVWASGVVFHAPGTCDGVAHPWSAKLDPDLGKLRAGSAQAYAGAEAVHFIRVTSIYIEQPLRLRPRS
jgi:hypothetical protein